STSTASYRPADRFVVKLQRSVEVRERREAGLTSCRESRPTGNESGRLATWITRSPQGGAKMDRQHSVTWLITGCSTGFGRELARAVVARGYRAVVTARSPHQVEDLVAGHRDRALALRLDVTDPAQVDEAVRRAEEHFGGIDVLVNNAGIGYFAAVEESEEKEIHRLLDINFFGLAKMTHAVLPEMRKHRRGHIFNL